MVTSQMITDMVQGKRPSFIFIHDGRVQHWSQNNKSGILVATTREAADAFAKKLTEKKGESVIASEVGTIEGETLGGQISEAVDLDTGGIYVTDDGATVYFFQVPRQPTS